MNYAAKFDPAGLPSCCRCVAVTACSQGNDDFFLVRLL